MVYYDKARLDGLAKRHETILELTDYFVSRDDFLEYRKAVFEPRPKKFGPADKDTQRPIIVKEKPPLFLTSVLFFSSQSITERYGRNPQSTANDDVQELVYAIKDDKFVISYHRDQSHITPSTR